MNAIDKLDIAQETILEAALRLSYRYGKDSIPGDIIKKETRVKRGDYDSALAALCIKGFLKRNRDSDNTYALV